VLASNLSESVLINLKPISFLLGNAYLLSRGGELCQNEIPLVLKTRERPCSPFIEQELRTLPDADKQLRTLIALFEALSRYYIYI